MLTTQSPNPASSPARTPKKRSRRESEEDDEQVVFDMELDDGSRATSLTRIEDLLEDEFLLAQDKAVEHLEKSLFIEIEVPDVSDFNVPKAYYLQLTKTKKDLFDGSNFDFYVPKQDGCLQKNPLVYCCQLILGQGNVKPSHFTDQKPSARYQDIKACIDHPRQQTNSLLPTDTGDLVLIFIELIKELPQLIPKSLHPACQGQIFNLGILALNQASTNRKVVGATVRTPSPSIRSLIANIILLLPRPLFIILRSVVEFCTELYANVVPKSRPVWARQISLVLGPAMLLPRTQASKTVKSRGYDKHEFAATFFELLLHCHGLHHEAHTPLRELWCLHDSLMKKIRKELLPKRTPSKRSMSTCVTPRKSISRTTLVVRQGFSACAKRNLFKSLQAPSQQSIFY